MCSRNFKQLTKNLQKLTKTCRNLQNLSKLPKTYLVLNLNLRWTSIKVKKSCKYICMSFKSLNFPNFKTTVSVEADVHGDCDTQQTELRKRGKGSPWKVVFHSDNVQRRMPFFSFLQFAAALVCSGRICRSQLGHVFRRAYTSPLRSTVFSHWESTLSSNTIGNATRLHHAQISSWNSCFFLKKLEAPTIGANSLHPWKSISKESLDLRTQLMVRMCCALCAEIWSVPLKPIGRRMGILKI